MKNRRAVTDKHTLYSALIQCTTWLLKCWLVFGIFFRFSIRVGLVTVFFCRATGLAAAENVPSNLYYRYQNEKGVIHYTNKPDTRMYSLFSPMQETDNRLDIPKKTLEDKGNQEACISDKKEIIYKLIPPGFPNKTKSDASVDQDAALDHPGEKTETKKNTNEGKSDKPTHAHDPGENQIPDVVLQKPLEKMILASKKLDNLSLRERKGARLESKNKKQAKKLIEEIDQLIIEAATQNGLSPSLLKAIIRVESNFNPRAVSPKGAAGLMQIMPDNFPALNVQDPFDLRQNIMGGASYLRQLLDYFKLDMVRAVAAYNAGPFRVEKANGIPNIKETRSYVQKVLKYYAQYKERQAQ